MPMRVYIYFPVTLRRHFRYAAAGDIVIVMLDMPLFRSAWILMPRFTLLALLYFFFFYYSCCCYFAADDALIFIIRYA